MYGQHVNPRHVIRTGIVVAYVKFIGRYGEQIVDLSERTRIEPFGRYDTLLFQGLRIALNDLCPARLRSRGQQINFTVADREVVQSTGSDRLAVQLLIEVILIEQMLCRIEECNSLGRRTVEPQTRLERTIDPYGKRHGGRQLIPIDHLHFKGIRSTMGQVERILLRLVFESRSVQRPLVFADLDIARIQNNRKRPFGDLHIDASSVLQLRLATKNGNCRSRIFHGQRHEFLRGSASICIIKYHLDGVPAVQESTQKSARWLRY